MRRGQGRDHATSQQQQERLTFGAWRYQRDTHQYFAGGSLAGKLSSDA
jgi:hypothetical protein